MYTFPKALYENVSSLCDSRRTARTNVAPKIHGGINRRSIVHLPAQTDNHERAYRRAVDFQSRLLSTLPGFPGFGNGLTYHLDNISFRWKNLDQYGQITYEVVGAPVRTAIQTRASLTTRQLYRIYDSWIRGRDNYTFPTVRIDGKCFALSAFSEQKGRTINVIPQMRHGL